MALLKGPKLLNAEFLPSKSVLFIPGIDNWLLGCLLLLGSSFFWSLWMILQVFALPILGTMHSVHEKQSNYKFLGQVVT